MIKRTVTYALLVASDPEFVATIRELFNHQAPHAFDLDHVGSIADAEKHLATHDIDVVLLDSALADAPGLGGIARIHAVSPHIPSVLLCAEDEDNDTSKLIKNDLQDYLIKGQIRPNELMRTMRNAVSRKNLQESALRDENRAQVTLNSIGDAVICTDKDGNISYLNPVAESMTGWLLTEAAGRPLTEAFHIIDSRTGLRAANPMAQAIGEEMPVKLPADCILVRRDGHQIYIEDSVAPIQGAEGTPAGWVLVFRDVTATRELAAKIAHLAEHDALTGLPNRLLLNDRLGQAIAAASRSESRIAVLFLDLDGFKHINDSLGHSTGDKLLESVAARLQHCIRTPDTVSRQGGDEFIILLSDVQHPEDAGAAAGRILKALKSPHPIADRELHIAASIGISIFPDDGLDAETLIKNADIAMYQAKENGTRTFRFFTPEMNVFAVERQEIEQELHGAIERNELSLHYQPKIDLKSGAMTGVEALLRWTHPARGDVPPARFIPVAESSGLILPIGQWVLREACSQAKTWLNAGLPQFTIAVNVSLVQFRDPNFLDHLFAILSETGLDPQLLELKVTESALMDRPELTARLLQTLRQKGIKVSMDDFGTGYSSLSYLSKIPLDALKIDQAFVHQISADPEHRAIVTAIISMARSLNLRVIAEGVETPEEWAFLSEKDCDEAQGYFFSHAVPPDLLSRLIELQSRPAPVRARR